LKKSNVNLKTILQYLPEDQFKDVKADFKKKEDDVKNQSNKIL
jgi:hypothetical protein